MKRLVLDLIMSLLTINIFVVPVLILTLSAISLFVVFAKIRRVIMKRLVKALKVFEVVGLIFIKNNEKNLFEEDDFVLDLGRKEAKEVIGINSS